MSKNTTPPQVQTYVSDPERTIVEIERDSKSLFRAIHNRERTRKVNFQEALGYLKDEIFKKKEESASEYCPKGIRTDKFGTSKPYKAHYIHETLLRYADIIDNLTPRTLDALLLKINRELDADCSATFSGCSQKYEGVRETLLFLLWWSNDLAKF